MSPGPRRCRSLLIPILAAIATVAALRATAATPRHAIAMHGEPAQPPGFSHMPYVNPRAPKGGRLVEGVLGTFDSLNPFVVRGLALPAIRGHVVESLMARGYDEPFTLYGLLASTIDTDDARNAVTFTLDPAARFSDGSPVTAEDVRFSWTLLRDHGRPNHRIYYGKVAKAEVLDGRTIRFDLAGSGDRELPLILALMPVLARHAVNVEMFEETTFMAPLGSGPYVVSAVAPGESVTLTRDPNYWGRHLAINRGLWNFDELRFDFYRDANAHLEAFKRGLFDVRVETDASRWEQAYDFAAVREGRVIKESFSSGLPKPMRAFVFNTRRPLFADQRVREAIGNLFDFEWINHNLYFDRYKRTVSYFEGSELSFAGRAADTRERALLAPFADSIRPEAMDGSLRPPVSDGSGRDRRILRGALALLAQAGFELRRSRFVSPKTGKPVSFEILVTSREEERLAALFVRSLERAGIEARVRSVDAVQYDRRRLTFDFDMILNRWDQSLSPGNEQAFYWGSAAAGEDGSRNYMGVRSEAADAMIAALLRARDREDFVAAIRALDRVLVSGFYVVPLFHAPEQWVARWSRIRRPEKTPLSGYLPESWWYEP